MTAADLMGPIRLPDDGTTFDAAAWWGTAFDRKPIGWRHYASSSSADGVIINADVVSDCHTNTPPKDDQTETDGRNGPIEAGGMRIVYPAAPQS